MTQDAQLVAGVRELVSVENNSHIGFRNIVSRINETCFPFTRQPSPPALMWKKMVKQRDKLPCREVTKNQEWGGGGGGARTGRGTGARAQRRTEAKDTASEQCPAMENGQSILRITVV